MENRNPQTPEKKPGGRFALYAILAVGLLYLIIQVVLHFTGKA